MPKGYVLPAIRKLRDEIRDQIIREWKRRESFTPKQFRAWLWKSFPNDHYEAWKSFEELKREGHFHRIAGYGAGSIYAPGEVNLRKMKKKSASQALESLRRVNSLLLKLEQELLLLVGK